jgi:5,10-methylenetetrahydromethanopterin reductase
MLHGSFPMPDYGRLAQAAERHPFDLVTVHDVVWWRPVWPILTLVAAATTRVQVGPDVTHPYLSHPVQTAANLAALDELSGGRAVLGAGRGSLLGPLGISRRGSEEAVREMVEVIQHLLSGDRSAYLGRHFSVAAGAAFYWRPPRPAVPVFAGAFGPRMVQSAVAWADEIMPPGIWRPEFFADLRDRVAAGAAASGRSIQVGCEVWLALDRDAARARRLGKQVLARFLPDMKPMTDFYGIGSEELAAVRRGLEDGGVEGAAEAISDSTLDCFVAAGDPDRWRPACAGCSRPAPPRSPSPAGSVGIPWRPSTSSVVRSCLRCYESPT